MAIRLPQGFKITSRQPIDTRLLMSKAEMLAAKDSLMPDKYFTICSETGEIFLYNKSTTEISSETGKFKALGISLGEAEDGLILMYGNGLWNPVDLTDDKSIIYISDSGLQIKGYDSASQGYMLVKDLTEGIAWIKPLSEETLNLKVQEAALHATTAGNYATAAGNSAITAETASQTAQRINQQTMNWVNSKFWWGSETEYNLLESIDEGTFYFVLIG